MLCYIYFNPGITLEPGDTKLAWSGIGYKAYYNAKNLYNAIMDPYQHVEKECKFYLAEADSWQNDTQELCDIRVSNVRIVKEITLSLLEEMSNTPVNVADIDIGNSEDGYVIVKKTGPYYAGSGSHPVFVKDGYIKAVKPKDFLCFTSVVSAVVLAVPQKDAIFKVTAHDTFDVKTSNGHHKAFFANALTIHEQMSDPIALANLCISDLNSIYRNKNKTVTFK